MGQAKWKTFTKEELQKFANDSISYAALAEKMGYASTGGSGPKAAKEAIAFHNLDISHFLHQGHNKNNFDYSRFSYGNAIKSANMLPALVALKGHKCEKCGNVEWLGSPITLEVHHKDGDHLNNVVENLELLCPNCHSLTENWRGKNIQQKSNGEHICDEDFVMALRESKSVRQALLTLGLTAAGGNYARAYELVNKYSIKHLMK